MSLYPKQPVLIVDDEQTALDGLEMILEGAGFEHLVLTAKSAEVMELFVRERPCAVLLDLCMPGVDGRTLLKKMHQADPQVPVIVVTGYNDVEVAISCMKAGAFDYLVKPAEEPRLVTALRRAVEFVELKSEYTAFRDRVLDGALANPAAFAHLLTGSRKMFALFQYVEAVAPGPRPVLITGETGTGKELLARAVHLASGRDGSFVSVNLAGLDDHMVADTLFGHLKGAFTGADSRRGGLVADASGGTLFLDEIGELSTTSQVKLLRLLQEGEYFPLGSDAKLAATCRIVAATNVDLNSLMADGRFRTDLYYRLATHQVKLPPLRDRKEDIALLLDHFLTQAADALGKPVPTPPKELSRVLASYHFPGNVRELESMVVDAVSRHRNKVLSMEVFKTHMALHGGEGGEMGGQSTPQRVAGPFSGMTRLPTLAEARGALIEEALIRASGNQKVAAQMMGISRSGLSKALSRQGTTDDG